MFTLFGQALAATSLSEYLHFRKHISMFPKADLSQTQTKFRNPAILEPQLADDRTPAMTYTSLVCDILATELFVRLTGLYPSGWFPVAGNGGDASSVSRRCIPDEAQTSVNREIGESSAISAGFVSGFNRLSSAEFWCFLVVAVSERKRVPPIHHGLERPGPQLLWKTLAEPRSIHIDPVLASQGNGLLAITFTSQGFCAQPSPLNPALNLYVPNP